MDARQIKLNAEYQGVLNALYGGRISLASGGKYLNNKAVAKHHCTDCKTAFYARPRWLITKRQPHECFTVSAETLKSKRTPKKSSNPKKGQSKYAPKVSEEMKLEMVQLYQQGGSLNSIASKFEVTAPTVKNHLKKAGVKIRA